MQMTPTEADFAAYDAADARARAAYCAQDRTSSSFQTIGEFDRREFAQAIAEARPKWRPIETAPKDKDVLVYQPSENIVISAFWQEDGYFHGWMNWSCRSDGWQLAPTHWMPLPEPPQ
jgi:hypothetical protein